MRKKNQGKDSLHVAALLKRISAPGLAVTNVTNQQDITKLSVVVIRVVQIHELSFSFQEQGRMAFPTC